MSTIIDENPKKVCYDCDWYHDEDLPDTCGCGECRRFPPTAIKKCDYTGSKYPVVSEYNLICGEFKFVKRPTFEEVTGMTIEEYNRKKLERVVSVFNSKHDLEWM